MDTFRISDDSGKLDVDLIHRFLSEESHWARGVSLEAVHTSIRHSLCFGGFLGSSQVAFGRVVTDYTRFGYVLDVFVLPEHRGRGFSKMLMKAMLSHPKLEGVALLLRSSTAQGLYTKLGFTALSSPENYLRFSPTG
jgi:ribosomal protein S18 acetylase RimI-like enzyme